MDAQFESMSIFQKKVFGIIVKSPGLVSTKGTVA